MANNINFNTMQTFNPDYTSSITIGLGDSLIFRANYQSVRIQTDDILYIQALADYVIIKTRETKHITLSTMKDMARLLEGRGFARTHRSYIVNLEHIKKVKGSTIVVENEATKIAIPVGRAYKKDFRQCIAA